MMGRGNDAWEHAVHSTLKFAPIEIASFVGGFLVRQNVRRNLKHIPDGARRTLKTLNPEMSDAEIERIVWRFLDNVGRMMAEFSVLSRLERENRLTFSGFEPVIAVQGREPLVAIALHTGNWEAMGAGLRHLGIKTATFYLPPESDWQRRVAIAIREQLGFQLLTPDRKGLREAIDVLKANGNVIIFGDEARGGQTMAPLFGRPPHERGNLAVAARLARKMHCRLVVSHVERLPRVHFRLNITAPFALPDDTGRTLLDDVAFLNDQIEPIIRRNLDNWYFLDDAIEPIG